MPNSDDKMDSPASAGLKGYFRAIGLTALAVLIAVVTLNYLVDPYLIHQWDTPPIHRLSPAQQRIVPWGKTYAAYRYRPEVVYLGSSRTEIGLPTDSPVFAGKRVFNLALAGASFGDAINMLHHTSVFHRPEIVVWGLDYGWQFREKNGNHDLVPELVATGPSYPLRRTLLNLRRSMSLAMAGDAVQILSGTAEQKCPSLLATYGQKPPQCLEYIMRDEGGTAEAFEKVLKKPHPLGHLPDVPAAIQLMDQVTDDYCRQGTVFRFYIQPVHALAELSYWATRWQELDDWKRSLTTVIDARRRQGCDIRLVDFSGFNRITSEAIPQATGLDNMQYYWEQSHYRSEVGEMMLERLFRAGQQDEMDDFGVELTGATIERHLKQFSAKRQDYISRHPRETRDMIGHL